MHLFPCHQSIPFAFELTDGALGRVLVRPPGFGYMIFNIILAYEFHEGGVMTNLCGSAVKCKSHQDTVVMYSKV